MASWTKRIARAIARKDSILNRVPEDRESYEEILQQLDAEIDAVTGILKSVSMVLIESDEYEKAEEILQVIEDLKDII